MAFDIFISHSTKDKNVADAVCATLEGHGMRCWIAPRDVRAGTVWDEEIVQAIDECRLMVLILSSSSNSSREIAREVKRAFSQEIPVLPFRIEDIELTKVMAYYMTNVHWLDALTPPLERHLAGLARAAQALLSAATDGHGAQTQPRATISIGKEPVHAGVRRIADWPRGLRLGLLAVFVAFGGVWIALGSSRLPISGSWCAFTGVKDCVSSAASKDQPQIPPDSVRGREQRLDRKASTSDNAGTTCEELRQATLRQGRRLAVACNTNTAPGFYWEVSPPRIRPYGYYGMVGSGGEPSCAENTDLGKTAESVSFESSPEMWVVRESYCRGNGPYGTATKCAVPDESGTVFNTNSIYSGVFRVVCKKQTR